MTGSGYGNDAAAAKRELRSRMRVVRRAIADDGAERARRSAIIGVRIVDELTSRWAATSMAGRRLLVYQPLPGEPDLSVVERWAVAAEIERFTPVVDGVALRVMPGDVDPEALDAVIVPGVAFTTTGRRLGQGGGHFDRFLPRLDLAALTIGVAFAEQLVDDLPAEAHDIAVQLVITDA